MLNDQAPTSFNVRENLFPQDRPDLSPPEPPKQALSEETMRGMSIDRLMDMEIAGMVTSRLELAKTARRPRRLVWDKCWQNMKGVYDKTAKAAWQSTTFMPLTSKVVEVIASNIHSAVFAPEMPIEYQTKRSDLDQIVRSINEVIETDFDKCQAKAQFTDFIRNMCVMGTAIGEVGYLKERETVMIKENRQQMPPEVADMMKSLGIEQPAQFTPKEMLVKDYATIINVDPYDIYVEPRKQEFSKDSWVIRKGKITNRELKIGSLDQDPYYKYDNVTDDLLEGSGLQRTDQDPEKLTRRFALQDYNVYTHFLDPDREHELLTFYGQIPIWYLFPELKYDRKRQYDSVPGCIKVVDGQWVIWKRLSPWRDAEPPFFKANYIRIPSEFYGIGVAEMVMGLQTEKNEIRNSRMDNINLSMNKIIAVLKDAVPSTEWKRLVSEPGALWVFKGVTDIRQAMQQVEFGDVTKDSWMASQEVDREAEEVTAANKVTQAVGGADNEAGGGTFRGQMLNVQQATGRWMLYARLFEWNALIPAMKKFYQRIYQFKDIEQIKEILGGDRGANFQFVSPEDLDRIAKLVPLGVMTMENKGVKLAQMNQFTQTWMMMPFFKKLEMARKMAVEMGNPEPDSILFSDEEQKQYIEFQKQAMMENEQMMGGGAPGNAGAGQPSGNPGLLGPDGRPVTPQTGQRGNVPGGQPVSGNVPGPRQGMPRPVLQARGPGASRLDLHGMPLS